MRLLLGDQALIRRGMGLLVILVGMGIGEDGVLCRFIGVVWVFCEVGHKLIVRLVVGKNILLLYLVVCLGRTESAIL